MNLQNLSCTSIADQFFIANSKNSNLIICGWFLLSIKMRSQRRISLKVEIFSLVYILLTVCRIKFIFCMGTVIISWICKNCIPYSGLFFFLKYCNRNYICSVDHCQSLQFVVKRIALSSNSKFARVLPCSYNSIRYCTIHSSIPEGTVICAPSKNTVMNTCLRVSSAGSLLRLI